ncbi:MAG: winged helix-turn-helix domain-containing protein [Alphaproteobacteria bacterium]|nr:winged helix-turn-helix domain-containing protein [Alphaproteobacteria bacterium]
MSTDSLPSDFAIFASHQTHREFFEQLFAEYLEVNEIFAFEEMPKLEEFVKNKARLTLFILFNNDLTASDIEKADILAKKHDIFAASVENLPIKSEYLDGFCQFWTFPVRPGEIVTRLRGFQAQKQRFEGEKPVKMGKYRLDPAQSLFHLENGNPVRLTDKERDILLFLYQNKPQGPVSKDRLLKHVWGYAENVESRTLETHIYRLRQKIEKDSSRPCFLITNDQGYCLEF